jgi:hypothetical protein
MEAAPCRRRNAIRDNDARNAAAEDHAPMTSQWDGLLLDCTLATLAGDGFGLVERGALAWRDGRVAWVGAQDALPADAEAAQTASAHGALVTPGLVDCHTHLVFGGDRAREFEQRLHGASYEEIARAGGGIASSVRATREASEDDLLAQSLPRARALLADGVTTLEIKSGYGLDVDSELKMLRVAHRIGETLGIEVRTTLLAAHALPPEYAGRADDYIDHVCSDILPAAANANLADAVDAFCERSRSRPRRRGACSSARANLACASSCMPINSPTSAAPRSPRTSTRSPPIIWNGRTRTACARWPHPAASPCCCPARSTRCAKRNCRRSTHFARPACRSPSRPISTPALRRCSRCALR